MRDDATEEQVRWALAYDGYRHLAATPEHLQTLLTGARAAYAREARIPDWSGVDLLRGWAFLLVREDHFAGGGTLTAEWAAVLEALAKHPDASSSDVPPGWLQPARTRVVRSSGNDTSGTGESPRSTYGGRMLYDMTDGKLTSVPGTTFQAEKVLERAHLQAAVRDNIRVLGDDLLVVAEEFGDFEGAARRIDLLCVDRSAHLVVVELKRTEDGGHMELQALRYAAMISTMSFDDLIQQYVKHLSRHGDDEVAPDDARARLLEWLDEPEEDEVVLQRRVRIILASADFNQEITTTVLWLNEFYNLDITCVRLTPYRHGGSLLLDVQQVIPLPEAEELMVKLRRREAAAANAARSSGADWTPYVLVTPDGPTEPLRKRRAILALVSALAAAGVPGDALAAAVPHEKLRGVDGVLEGDELAEKFARVHQRPVENLPRWFLDSPIHQDGKTWVLSKQWGIQTEEVLAALCALAPEKFSFHKG